MFITPDNLNSINLEFTDYCNAACPMCSRFKWDGNLYEEKVNKNHNTLEVLQKNISKKIIKQLKRFYSCGTYGDPLMNPQCTDIFRWIKEINPNCQLNFHTNGGGRDTGFWEECANLGISVRFGIDGLEDTNHLYRRNVKWTKLMENISAFIKAGGQAHWAFLIFKHNEHQIEEARTLSKKLGFKSFSTTYSDRWKTSNWITGEPIDRSSWPAGDYFIEKPKSQGGDNYWDTSVKSYTEQQFNFEKKIICQKASNNNYEIFIRANGDVQPCCMLGDLDVHECKKLIQDPKSVNLNYTNLEDILSGDFFKLLDKGINQKSNDRLQNCFYTCGVN